MNLDQLERGKQIQKDKAIIEQFVRSIKSKLYAPVRETHGFDLKKWPSAEGLVANLEALIKVWEHQAIEKLEDEFNAL